MLVSSGNFIEGFNGLSSYLHKALSERDSGFPFLFSQGARTTAKDLPLVVGRLFSDIYARLPLQSSCVAKPDPFLLWLVTITLP